MDANFPTKATAMSRSKFYFGLFLITACTLMLQVIPTRISHTVAVASCFGIGTTQTITATCEILLILTGLLFISTGKTQN